MNRTVYHCNIATRKKCEAGYKPAPARGFKNKKFGQGANLEAKPPIGGLASKFASATEKQAIVEIVAYCLNHNHYHLILKQMFKDGIRKFFPAGSSL
ncbi:MAG: hypothetical protein WCJ51_00460 [Candidatus Moraniibacteriota bacterium]